MREDEIIVISGEEEYKSSGVHKKIIAMLIAIAFAVALVTYAGVTLVYEKSTITVGAVAPPLKWAQGSDYTTAYNLGYATGWTLSGAETYFSITVKGSPELEITIDDIFRVVETDSRVASFKVEITDAISGTLKSPTDKITTLKLRFWTGDNPPTTDDQAVGVLDLEGNAGAKTAAMSIDDTLKVQIIIKLASDARESESAIVKIRFSDIATS
jgi:hypothetical protein